MTRTQLLNWCPISCPPQPVMAASDCCLSCYWHPISRRICLRRECRSQAESRAGNEQMRACQSLLWLGWEERGEERTQRYKGFQEATATDKPLRMIIFAVAQYLCTARRAAQRDLQYGWPQRQSRAAAPADAPHGQCGAECSPMQLLPCPAPGLDARPLLQLVQRLGTHNPQLLGALKDRSTCRRAIRSVAPATQDTKPGLCAQPAGLSLLRHSSLTALWSPATL